MKEISLITATSIRIDGSIEENLVTFPYDDFDELSKGRPITKKLAKTLIKDNFWPSLANDKTAAVVFDSRPLMLILSQKGCKGIRFYLSKKGKKESDPETLVLVGVDENGDDLGVGDPKNGKKGSICTDQDNIEKTIIFEVGGGNYKNNFI